MFRKQNEPANTKPEAKPRPVPSAERLRARNPGSEKGGPNGRLTVGPDIRLIGASIEDCDTLFVEGRVEASMDSRVIHIAESGTFAGAAAVDEAEIHGHFEGNLTARERLVVHKTGRISGTVQYGKLTIEEGGEIAGDMAVIGTELLHDRHPSRTGPSNSSTTILNPPLHSGEDEPAKYDTVQVLEK